jgi:hypothetical protein
MTSQSRHVIDRRRHQNVQAGFLIAARTRRGPSPDPVPSKAPVRHRLARPLEIERSWAGDREAMLAALRVALGLPRVLPNDREADR